MFSRLGSNDRIGTSPAGKYCRANEQLVPTTGGEDNGGNNKQDKKESMYNKEQVAHALTYK